MHTAAIAIFFIEIIVARAKYVYMQKCLIGKSVYIFSTILIDFLQQAKGWTANKEENEKENPGNLTREEEFNLKTNKNLFLGPYN